MNIYDYEVVNRNGETVSLKEFKDKVLIIVNTATGCGFTPQYEGLETLYKKYHEKGLEVLDFPCNQFGNQDGIKNKMAMKAVEKISKTCKKDGDIKWNFTKFIVDRKGNVVGRYSPTFKPEDMEEDILKLL